MKRTKEELEAKLAPCPLCGGIAKVQEAEYSRSGTFLRHTIVCELCGLTLDWEQEFYVAEHVTACGLRVKTDRIAVNCDVVTAWNRRAGKEAEG